MRKLSIIGIFCQLVLLSPFGYSEQGTLESMETNLQILDSIPLIPNYEKPRPDEEQIASSLIELFESFADRNRNEDGSLNRGTHAKGQCFASDFKVFSVSELQAEFGYSESQAVRLKKGLFLNDGVHYADMRIANADGLGRKNDDKAGDVRGFSFSVYSDRVTDFAGVGRQDFMMNSTPGFSNGGIKGFYEVVKTANLLAYKDFRSFFPNPLYIGEIASGLMAIANSNSSQANLTSLADISYWSNLPYTHGTNNHLEPDDIVKYKAEPCSEAKSPIHPSDDPDYLQKDIAERASAGSICFDIKVQIFDRKKLLSSDEFSGKKFRSWSNSDWIEEGGLEWPESALPFYHIARLQVPKGSVIKDCDNKSINTRIHSSLENLPIGSIARVRTYVEEYSRENRMKQKVDSELQ